MAIRHLVGKAGKVLVGSAKRDMNVEGWNLTEECDWQETTNTGSNGFEESIPGTKKCSGSFDASYDAYNKPYSNPPNLTAGQTVILQLDIEANVPCFRGNTVAVDSLNIVSTAKGVIKFTCNWHTIGAYTIG